MSDPSTGSGSALSAVERADRRSRIAASVLALVAGASAWLSAGTIGISSGGADRVAALPSVSLLVLAMFAAVLAASVLRLRLPEAWPLATSVLLWLPFLPGPIPAAFMLWEGSIEILVWAIVAAGLLYARLGDAADPGGSSVADPRHAPWIVAALVVALSLWAFTQVRSVVPGGDEPHYLVATQSLLADRDLRVENNYAAGGYLGYFGGRLQPHFMQRSVSGEIYSIHSPGVSAVVLPAYAMAGYVGAVVMVILIAGLTAALTWITAWRISGSVPGAWVGVIAVFATAPFFFHTFTIYPDGPGALPVMAAVWLIARLDESWEPPPKLLVAIGAGLAVLPWLHTRFALLAAALAAIVIARLAVRPALTARLTAFVAVPVMAAVAWFAYFWLIWGTPSPLAPYGADLESSSSYIARGLSGLLFDQQFGVLTTAPVYAIAMAGMWPLVRLRPRLAVELMVIAVPYVVAVSTYAMWWGGTSAPARFIAAILPLAALSIAYAWARVPWLRIPALLLLLAGAAMIVPRVLVEDGRFIFNTRNAFDPTIEWLASHVDLAMALPSVHRDAAGGALMDAAAWLVAMAIVAADAYAAHRLRVSRGGAWTSVALSGALMAMGAVSMAWTFHARAAITADRSTLAALMDYRPWHVSFVDARSWRPIVRDEFLQRATLDVPVERHAALLRAARVPAGVYEIAIAQPAPDGTLAVVVGRNDPPLEATPSSLFTLRLPVAAASLSVRGESMAADGSVGMRIRAAAIAPPVNPDHRFARRAARYGRARVFFFDERAYLEPKGFWTRAEGRATVVIDADEDARQAGLPIAFTAGGAATTIGISVGDWSQSYSMTPGERRTVTLPPLGDAAAWVLNIHSGPGFRPFEREPGSIDVRSLAAWFEIP